VKKYSIKTNSYITPLFTACGRRLLHYLMLLMLLMLATAGQAAAQRFSFAAFGDAPYSESEQAQWIDVIASMNRAPLAFVIHVGDFKNGWSPCTDALFHQRRDEFALLHHPLIYTPGDNEWTDCWRTAGAPETTRDPLHRLQLLRRLYFADGYSLGQKKIALERQNAEFPEHARWAHGGVLFAALNVPGGDNNARLPRESAARGVMVAEWITETFRAARAQRHGAVVLAMQANPFSQLGGVRRAYQNVMEVMIHETRNFEGEVLLIHGDTHRYRFDQPLVDPRTREPLRNFTRLEVFGSPSVNWVRVSVDRRNGKVTFAVTPGFE
jgi:hypothetical protein